MYKKGYVKQRGNEDGVEKLKRARPRNLSLEFVVLLPLKLYRVLWLGIGIF